MTSLSLSYRRSAVGGACLVALAWQASSAQNRTASVSGIVRSAQGAPVNEALVVVDRRRAQTDSLGRYTLDSLDVGPQHIIVRRIGFSRADTTVTVRAGEAIR